MPTCNILSSRIIFDTYADQGWVDLCDFKQPNITYNAFITGLTETYNNNTPLKDRVFSDYVTQLYTDCLSIDTDTFVSGGTLNAATGVVTFTNTTGGTLDVSGFNGFTSYWSANTDGSISNSGTTSDVKFYGDVYTDQIRRYTNNSTTTKINLSSSNVIKLFAGHSTNEVFKVESGSVTANGNLTVTGTTSYTGAISGTGSVTAIGGFVGDVTGNVSGAAGIAAIGTVTNDAEEKMVFLNGSNMFRVVSSGFTFNPSTKLLTATGFIGNLTGNADTATKIVSITNNDIVQLTASQTLTNKTIAASQVTEISNITAAEGAQIENIGTTEISATQWGYLGAATGAITNTNDDVSVANLKTKLAGGFGSNAVTIGDSDDVVTIGNDLTVTGDLTVNGDSVTFQSSDDSEPVVMIKNTNSNNSGAELRFIKDKGAAGANSDEIGIIKFMGDNAAQEQTYFAHIKGGIDNAGAADGTEGGAVRIAVASHDGELQNGLVVQDGNAEDEVDVEIANGTASVTTIAGTLTMGSTAALTNDGLVVVANQSNITGVGTISSGVWNGTIIAEAKLENQSGTNTGDETLSTINALDITEVGTISSGVWQGTTIKTDYIGDNQVTEDKLADTLLAEIDANTAKVTNSDQSKADINALDITEVGTITSGVWNGTDVTVAHGGTGVSTLGADAVLIGNGTGAITSSTNLTFDDTDLSLAGTGKIEFRDAAIYIQSSTDGQLDLVADTTIDVTAPTVEINSSTKLDVNANELDMDLTDSSNITITSSEAAEDLTIEQVGANDSSIIIQAAGTGTDAIRLNASAGSIDIDSGDNITVNAADDITIAAAGGDITISTGDAYGTKISAREFSQPGTSANDRKECDITYVGGQGTIALGDLVYMHTDGRWNRTDANAVATATGLLGIALGSNVSESGVVLRGMFTLDHDLGDDQMGRPLYLSGTVAQATFTAPSATGDVVRIIGYQLGNANEIWFNPDNTWVELS